MRYTTKTTSMENDVIEVAEENPFLTETTPLADAVNESLYPTENIQDVVDDVETGLQQIESLEKLQLYLSASPSDKKLTSLEKMLLEQNYRDICSKTSIGFESLALAADATVTISQEAVGEKLVQFGKWLIERIKAMFAWIRKILKSTSASAQSAKVDDIAKSLPKGKVLVPANAYVANPFGLKPYKNLLLTTVKFKNFVTSGLGDYVKGTEDPSGSVIKNTLGKQIQQFSNGIPEEVLPGGIKINLNEDGAPFTVSVNPPEVESDSGFAVDGSDIKPILTALKGTSEELVLVEKGLDNLVKGEAKIISGISKAMGLRSSDTASPEYKEVSRNWLKVTAQVIRYHQYASQVVTQNVKAFDRIVVSEAK